MAGEFCIQDRHRMVDICHVCSYFNIYRALRHKLSINKKRFVQPGKKSEVGVTFNRVVSALEKQNPRKAEACISFVGKTGLPTGSWHTYSTDKQSLIAVQILCIYSVKKLKKC